MALDVDGTGATEVATGLPFFDHMVSQLGRHGGFDLKVAARGDLEVDAHHTVEDVGITLGEVLAEALGDKAGIRRFGSVALPSTRPWSRWPSTSPAVRSWPTTSSSRRTPTPSGTPPFDPQLAEEFWRAFATAAGLTLHIRLRHRQEHPPHRGGVVQGGGPGPPGRRPPRGRGHPLHQGHAVTAAAPGPAPRPGDRRPRLRHRQPAVGREGPPAPRGRCPPGRRPGPGRRAPTGWCCPGWGPSAAAPRPCGPAAWTGRPTFAVERGVPFLGICVGFQLLYEGSDEDPSHPGLGVLPGVVRRLPGRGQAPPDAVEPAGAVPGTGRRACWPGCPTRPGSTSSTPTRPTYRRHLLDL